jgi:hypothetical protein
MKYSNTLYTGLLSTVLVVPFAISFLAPVLEPYPAVLLPPGGTRIKTTEDQMDLGRISIYGKVAGRDAWTRLSPPKFLSPIAPEFFSPLAQRNFGLSPVGPIANRTRVGLVITIDPRKVPEEEVRNAKQWFRARLKDSGCDDNVLRITQEVLTFRRSDGAQIGIRSENDKVFDLH